MSDSMVERVARAIYETEPFSTAHGHAMAWSAVAESQKDGFRLKARDAIKAMREPSLDMVDSACFAWIKLYPAFEGQKRQPTTGELVTATFNAMIDAASNGK